MPTPEATLAKMLRFDGLTATFGSASGPCQRDVGLMAEDFAGRTMEHHANVLTGITSILVQASVFGAVRVNDTGTVGGASYKVRDREFKNDGALLRLFLEAA